MKRIAVVGPLADQTGVLLGNYNGTPTHTVTILEGMKAEFPNAQITFVRGTSFRRPGHADPRCGLHHAAGKPGVKASYTTRMPFDGPRRPCRRFATRTESGANLTAATPSRRDPGQAHRHGALGRLPQRASHREQPDGIRSTGIVRVTIDGQQFRRLFAAMPIWAAFTWSRASRPVSS